MQLLSRLTVGVFLIMLLALAACKHGDKIYSSDCNDGHDFKRVSLAGLMDSIDFYNNKYVEISGKFYQDKTITILTGDKKGKEILVEFSNGCPLFLSGSRVGFFDYDNNNGQLTPANNKLVVLKGEIICHTKADVNGRKISISHISYVQL